MTRSVLIVDGTAVAYRAFYAVRGLSTRVAEVDAQIALYRGEAPKPARGKKPTTTEE